MAVFRNIDFHAFVESLVKTIELKDIYTAGHSKRVSEYTELIAKGLHMSAKECSYMHIAGHLHDIGKIGIPDGVLLKTGRLSDAEYQIMQQHAAIGASIFENQEGFKNMADIIRHHHERYDGLGYPDRLKGDEIPKESAIIAIADSFDAMTSSRSYRTGMPVDQALDQIKKNKGKQFHPELADIFFELCMRDQEKIFCIITSQNSCRERADYQPFKSMRIDQRISNSLQAV